MARLGILNINVISPCGAGGLEVIASSVAEYAEALIGVVESGIDAPLDSDAFSLADAESLIGESDWLLRVTDDAGEPAALGSYRLIDAVPGTTVLWESLVAVRRDWQGRGIATDLLNAAVAACSCSFPSRIGYVGGRSQNPGIWKRYSSYGPLLPLDAEPTPADKAVIDGVVQAISQVADADPDSLIVRNAYRSAYGIEGTFGNITRGRKPLSGRWAEYLDRHRFNPVDGDAIVSLARVAPRSARPCT